MVYILPDFQVTLIRVGLSTVEAGSYCQFLRAFQSVIPYHPVVQDLRPHEINDLRAQKRCQDRDLLQVREDEFELPDGVHKLNQVPQDWRLGMDELWQENTENLAGIWVYKTLH